MDPNERADAKKLHSELDYIGLRAQATAVAMLQMCAELARVGVFGDENVERIKRAVHREIMVSYHQRYGRKEFEDTLRKRLDAIFPAGVDVETSQTIGSVDDLETALDSGVTASARDEA